MFITTLVKIYPSNPQNGNVKNQVITIFFAIFQFTLESLLDAPTPITAQFLVWFELTGIPNKDDPNKKRRDVTPVKEGTIYEE